MLVIKIFDDEVVALRIDVRDDCFDGSIAFDENAYIAAQLEGV